MKKFILIILVSLGFITSCSNENLEINTYTNLSVNISTQNVFDEFGYLQNIKEYLGEGNNIGLYNYLYNKKGELVKSDIKYNNTLDMLTINFDNVESGSYTIVTVELIVNPNRGMESPYWNIVGQDNLNSLEIRAKQSNVPWTGVVGLYTNKIDLNDKNELLKITPRPIGSMIEIEANYFNYSHYNYISFYTKDMPKGRLLSPEYKGADRYRYDQYNQSSNWSERGYISESDGLDLSEKMSLYFLEDGMIRYRFGSSIQSTTNDGDSTVVYWPENGNEFNLKEGKNHFGGIYFIGGQQKLEVGLFDNQILYDNWLEKMYEMHLPIISPYLIWGVSSAIVEECRNIVEEYMNINDMVHIEDGHLNVVYDGGFAVLMYSSYQTVDNRITYKYYWEKELVYSPYSLKYVYMKIYGFTLDQIRNWINKDFDYKGIENSYLGEESYHFCNDDSTASIKEKEDGFIEILFSKKS